MTKRLAYSALLLCASSLIGTSADAQTRSGRASYHLHTSEMVTAARHEPRGSLLKVTNPQNGKSVLVRVNDKGPFSPPGRILDLSTGAFRELYGGLGRGHGPVSYEVVGRELSARGGSPSQRRKSKSRRSKSRRHR